MAKLASEVPFRGVDGELGVARVDKHMAVGENPLPPVNIPIPT